MARGRRPDPAALKAAKGNPGKRALPLGEAEEKQAGRIRAPSALSHAAAALWRQIAPELERMNFLRESDRHAFGRYCDALSRFWKVTEQIRKEGVVYVTDSMHGSMKRINPLFIVEERLSKRLTELEDRFGLTPASRQQIMLRLAQQQPVLPFAPAGVEQPKGDGAPTGGDAPPPGPIGFLGGPLH